MNKMKAQLRKSLDVDLGPPHACAHMYPHPCEHARTPHADTSEGGRELSASPWCFCRGCWWGEEIGDREGSDFQGKGKVLKAGAGTWRFPEAHSLRLSVDRAALQRTLGSIWHLYISLTNVLQGQFQIKFNLPAEALKPLTRSH